MESTEDDPESVEACVRIDSEPRDAHGVARAPWTHPMVEEEGDSVSRLLHGLDNPTVAVAVRIGECQGVVAKPRAEDSARSIDLLPDDLRAALRQAWMTPRVISDRDAGRLKLGKFGARQLGNGRSSSA
jgi:hypothetical protein